MGARWNPGSCHGPVVVDGMCCSRAGSSNLCEARWRLDIFREVRRQDATGSSQSPARAKGTSPGPARGRTPSAALGKSFNRFHLLSPRITSFSAIRGERKGEGGFLGQSRIRRFVACTIFIGTKRESPCGHLVAPSPWPSPPTRKMCWGRGGKFVGTLTQGGRRGDGGPELLPLAAPWLRSFDGALGGRSGRLPLHECPISMVPLQGTQPFSSLCPG